MAGLLSFTYASIIGVNVKTLDAEVAVGVRVGVWDAVEGVVGGRVGVVEAVAVNRVGEAVTVWVGVEDDAGGVMVTGVAEEVAVPVGVGEGVRLGSLPVSIMS